MIYHLSKQCKLFARLARGLQFATPYVATHQVGVTPGTQTTNHIQPQPSSIILHSARYNISGNTPTI